MARTLSNLYASSSLAATKTEIISAETGTTRLIRKATFTNNSGGTVSIDLYVDPDGASEVQIVDTKYLIDQETWDCPQIEGHIINASGTVDVTASATGVDLLISGVKIT